jgi:hypothetical protein
MLLGATGPGLAPLAFAAAAAPPAPTATSAVPAGGALTDAQHYAQGELPFNNKWVPIDTLFKDYQAARQQLKDLGDQAEAARRTPEQASDALNRAKVESAAEENLIRQEIAKARSIQIKTSKVLAEPPPQKPVPKPLPPEPTGTGTWTNNNNNNNNWNIDYGRLHAGWEKRRDEIVKTNKEAEDAYNKALAKHQQKHDEAQQQRDAATATIKDCADKLAKIAADLKAKQQEIQAGAATSAEEPQKLDQQVADLRPKIEAMTTALGLAPEDLRLKHGILAWKGVFYSPDEIRKLVSALEADAAKAKEKAKADAAAANMPTPETWRYAQQGDMDALKGLLDKAKAAAPDAAS